MADDDLNEAIRLSLQSAQEEEKRRKQDKDEEEALKKALQLSVDESPEGKENRQLKDELEFLKTKVRLLEDASKVDVERSQLRSLFHLINPNGSGDSINPAQLGALLEAASGHAIPPEEVNATLRALQPAGPNVNFDEFYKWWHSSSFSATDPALGSIRRLGVPAHRELFLRLVRRLLYNQGGLFPSPLNEDRAKIAIKVATSPEFSSKCGGRLYYVNDAKLAETRRKEMKVAANEADAIILSMSLSFVEGVDEFGLGELAGSLKDLLSLAKDEVSYSSYQVNLARENGQKRFRIVLCFSNNDDETLQKVKELIKNLNLKSFNCNLDFSQSFNTSEDDKKPIEGRVQLDAEVNTRLVEWLHTMAVADSERRRPKYLPPRNPNQTEETDFIQLFHLLQNLQVDVALDSMTTKWRQSYEDKKGPSRIPLGWREINNVLLRALAPAAENDNIPELVWDTYKNALSTFREVSNITVQYQHHLLVFDLRDIAIFQLFPTVEQLKALPPSAKKEEKPYKPKSRARAPEYALPPTSKSAQLKRGPWD